jgi:hypothetical protein
MCQKKHGIRRHFKAKKNAPRTASMAQFVETCGMRVDGVEDKRSNTIVLPGVLAMLILKTPFGSLSCACGRRERYRLVAKCKLFSVNQQKCRTFSRFAGPLSAFLRRHFFLVVAVLLQRVCWISVESFNFFVGHRYRGSITARRYQEESTKVP